MPLVVADTTKPASSVTPQQPATVAPGQAVVRPDPDASGANQGAKGNTPLSFRALLDPAVVGSLAQSTQATSQSSTALVGASENAAGQSIFSPDKLPTAAPPELSEAESAGLLSAAQATQPFDAVKPRPYLGATSRYAQAYFADTRTFAKRGESLEIKA